MRAAADMLWEQFGEDAISISASSASDMVRGWGAFVVGRSETPTLEDRLALIRPFADDSHFAVREFAWLSMRSHVIADTINALSLLEPWTHDESHLIRRFTSEVTRPIGVWSRHVPLLKSHPGHARQLLNSLRHDDHIYVQNSVGNWLNDAARTNPEWVRKTCANWLADGPTRATMRICRRGQRNLVPLAAGGS
jgi:3-methyladenine DNA glycosylase AlkC